MTTRRDRGALLWRVYAIALGFNALILVAFIAGSMFFTGGQMGESDTTKWQPVWYWPVFPVPAWLLIIPAAIAAVIVIPMCVLTPASHVTRLLNAAGVTGGSAASAYVFMFMFPAKSGVFPIPEIGTYVGPHWIALALSLVCLAVLVVAFLIKAAAYERMRKAGTLPQ
ncbi:hypothetical protein [Microbacterium allomyrinae]|uniref:Uncharacterized protein n=1 Tax=Microbacterium allomyrinae TaxID=2830666 RepID=A0A9X1LT43_9MICO|nr:hypothetical protein [Microbacterium allomyrinae]MCC2031687.1 hypothetical protein [Microbacterium allomyrinae]